MPRATKTKTISLKPAVQRKGLKTAKVRGFANSFSAYISKLIIDDAAAIKAAKRNGGEVRVPQSIPEVEVPA